MRITYRTSVTLILVISVITHSCLSSSKQDATNSISAELLQNDFQIFRNTLEESHPGIYWYNGKKDLDALFDSLYRRIDDSMSEDDFAKIILSAIARIKCVHTGARVSEKKEKEIFANGKLIPINIDFAEGKIFISKVFDTVSAKGLEIKTINGIAIDTILNTMLPLIPADGFITTYKYHMLRAGFFRESYALLYGQPEKFVIGVVDSFQQKKQIIVAAKTPAELSAAFPPNRAPIQSGFLQGDSIGLLSISTFEISSASFHEQVRNFFTALKKRNCQKLIIDLRGNGGGNNANVTKLFSYLSLKPFLHLKKTEMRTRDGIVAADDSYPGRKLQPVADNAFGGKLIVLANGGTVSAASEFVALVHGYRRGIVVGEETGGCYYGATGGNYRQLELPASKIRVRIPMVRIFTAVEDNFIEQPVGRGVLPDYKVLSTIAGIINNRDTELETACRVLDGRYTDSANH